MLSSSLTIVITLNSESINKKAGEIMPQLNLDDSHLQLGQVRTVSKDAGQTIESVELLLGEQTKAEMKIDENLNVMNLVVRDTVLSDIPQLQCSVNKETLKDFISGLTKLYNNLKGEQKCN